MASNSYSAFNAMVDIITSPSKAFDEIKQHTSWLWWPLLVGMLLAIAVFGYYYSWVDFSWLVEETIRQIPSEVRAERAEATRSFMKPNTILMTTVIGIVLVSMLIYTIQAVYFLLANKLTTGSDIGFGQWFAFSVWTGFVNIFGSLAALVVIMMADNNQLGSNELQVISLNSLLVHASPGEPWFTWANSFGLTTIWMLALAAIGYARWTGASMMKSTIVAVLPWALIFGIWAIII